MTLKECIITQRNEIKVARCISGWRKS